MLIFRRFAQTPRLDPPNLLDLVQNLPDLANQAGFVAHEHFE
jgi:hypothetical protein